MTADKSRRRFLKYWITMFVAAGTGIVSSRCGRKESEQEDNPESDACDDLTTISANDAEARNKLNYVDDSPDKNKICGKCKLFVPGSKEITCGSCMLFKGPVKVTGTCIYWAS